MEVGSVVGSVQQGRPERVRPRAHRWPRPLKFGITLTLLCCSIYVLKKYVWDKIRHNPKTDSENMNGLYEIGNPLVSGEQFNTDYKSKGSNFFDLYSAEIATKYGEVFWEGMPELPLPENIVKQFENGAIAVTGYEHDQVLVRGGPAGARPDLDVSVPFGWAYNHHYMMFINGKNSRTKRFVIAKEDVHAGRLPEELKNALQTHGIPLHDGHMAKPLNDTHLEFLVPVDVEAPAPASFAKEETDLPLPNSQFFSEANGGESRMSYHGYPARTAQIIKFPTNWYVYPMQIDTRNRACGISPEDAVSGGKNCPDHDPKTGNYTYYPGPEPKQARWPGNKIPLEKFVQLTGAPAPGSALSECPCTNRWAGDPIVYGKGVRTKVVDENAVTLNVNDQGVFKDGQCLRAVEEAGSCFLSVAEMGVDVAANQTVAADDRDSFPRGCSLGWREGDPGFAAGRGKSDRLDLSLSGVLKPIAYFNPADRGPQSEDQKDKKGTSCVSDPKLPRTSDVLTFSMIKDTGLKVVLKASLTANDVELEVTGPADRWFGIAFNAHYMMDKPYAIIFEGNGGTVHERKLGTCGEEACHCGGDRLPSSITVLTNKEIPNSDPKINHGKPLRKVVLQRSRTALTPQHYAFEAQFEIPMLSAVGFGPTFQYHFSHNKQVLRFFARQLTEFNCLCLVPSNGQVCNNLGQGCSTWIKDAAPECGPRPLPDQPGSQCGMLGVQKNPTLLPKTYMGGLNCCVNKQRLLDVGQENAEMDKFVLRYHMKFRIWYEPYKAPEVRTVVSAESDPSGRETTTPASHVDIVRLYWQSEANAGEYDVPPAFRRSDKFPVIGYPDWPVGKPTPGTHCTGDCPNGQDCDCFHEIVFRFRIQHPHPMRRRLSSRKEEAAAVVPGEEEDDNKVKFF